ncbi:MAG: cytochrome c biogenesis protein ResB, partial [Blastocatellia bacterium]
WYFVAVVIASGFSIIASGLNRLPSTLALIRPSDPRQFQSCPSSDSSSSVQVGGSPQVVGRTVAAVWQRHGFKMRTLESDEMSLVVVGQRRRWNRLAPYFLLLSILVILCGFFLTTRYGIVGRLDLEPGTVTNSLTATALTEDGPAPRSITLPFAVECLSVRQQLIDPRGGLEPANSMDWITALKIHDAGKDTLAQVRLNAPLSYRGYWFYQVGYRGLGDASQVTVSFVPANGETAQEVTLQRNESADVTGVGRVSFVRFFSDAPLNGQNTADPTDSYRNPAVKLRVETPVGQTQEVLATPDSPPGKSGNDNSTRKGMLFGGSYRAVLKDYDKSASYHLLSVDRDIGRIPTYIGFILLVIVIAALLCFSHQRVWATISLDDEESTTVQFSGDTNRYANDFRVKFEELTYAAIDAIARGRDQ